MRSAERARTTASRAVRPSAATEVRPFKLETIP